VLFTFPSRYWFTIGRQVVFSLGRWSSQLPAGFLVSRGTQDSARLQTPFAYRAFTLFRGPFQASSTRSSLVMSQSYNPTHLSVSGLGFSPFARRYLGNALLSLFLALLRCFSSGGSLPLPYFIQTGILEHYLEWVAPFGNPRINTCLRFPEAYRCLPRPSSAPGAKASTVCPL
jgi:hypothetical protein